MRFSLVDRIVSLEAGQSISAVKNLSLAEEYLADHFPRVPVMPGVLMLETLVQAGAWLMRSTEDFKYSTVLLQKARAVRFNNFVSPGKTLSVTVTLQERAGRYCTLKGTGSVDGNSAVNARLTLEQYNLADENPRLQNSDEARIAAMRELFTQLWSPTDVDTGQGKKDL